MANAHLIVEQERKTTYMATQTIERPQAVRVLPEPKAHSVKPSKQETSFFSKLMNSLLRASSKRALYRLEHQYQYILSPSEQALLAKEIGHEYLNSAGSV